MMVHALGAGAVAAKGSGILQKGMTSHAYRDPTSIPTLDQQANPDHRLRITPETEPEIYGRSGGPKQAPSGSQAPSKSVAPSRSPTKGAVAVANFAQKRPSSGSKPFSDTGQEIFTEAAGRPIKTIDDLAAASKNGDISPSQLPVDYVVVEGKNVIANTRTSEALCTLDEGFTVREERMSLGRSVGVGLR